jgi:transposase InsO family protein
LIDRELVLEVLCNALVHRPGTRDLIRHSDRGSQSASHDDQNALDQAGINCSMSGRGNFWNNAVAESFFVTPIGSEVFDQENS